MFSGQRLKEIREAQGMSQASVAKHLGISRSSYFNWEMVRRNLIKRIYRYWQNFLAWLRPIFYLNMRL